jgi:hypothetical protein
MWVIEELGFEGFAAKVAEAMGPGTQLAPAVHVTYDEPWERRDVLGVHPQKQVGFLGGRSTETGRIMQPAAQKLCRLLSLSGACLALVRSAAHVRPARALLLLPPHPPPPRISSPSLTTPHPPGRPLLGGRVHPLWPPADG